ncbi:endonuclease domain-containing protein [Mycobacterium sp.]|uniref:endonuclease domain-containing protein n=1 Tax=Mycobacterium sp. TaxID=1785 RepID=UPI003C74774C
MLFVVGLQGLIVASEAVASGTLTRQQVRANYTKLHRNVYVLNDLKLDAAIRARAAWLWSGRKAVVVGIRIPDRRRRKVRRIDMGWPEWKVGVEYEGEQHWTDPKQYEDDIEHLEFLAAQGWTIVRVSARQLRYDRDGIVRRVRCALLQARVAA